MKHQSFKEFWEDNNLDSKIIALLDSDEYTLYFKKDGEIFGSTEDGRVTFAKIKHPDPELPFHWKDEANFSATNLSKAIHGEKSQHLFGKKDIGKIEIIDKEEALEKLKKNTGDNFYEPTRINKNKVANFIQTVED